MAVSRHLCGPRTLIEIIDKRNKRNTHCRVRLRSKGDLSGLKLRPPRNSTVQREDAASPDRETALTNPAFPSDRSPSGSLPFCHTLTRATHTIETRLWLQEHDWLYDLLKSDRNLAPSFRCRDFISACVSAALAHKWKG